MSFVSWIERVFGGAEKVLSKDEQLVAAWAQPLLAQLVMQAKTLGKQDLVAGLQVLEDSVTTAVAAGTAAIASGQSPVTAAESAFLTTAAGEGKTALNNAESAAIKVGVAIAQQAATSAVTAVQAATTTPGATAG